MIEDHLAGSLEAGSHRLTVADGMITYVTQRRCLEHRRPRQRGPSDRAARLGRRSDRPGPRPDRSPSRKRCSDPGRAPGRSVTSRSRTPLPDGWAMTAMGGDQGRSDLSGCSSWRSPTSTPTRCQSDRARPAGRSDRRRPRLGVGRPARASNATAPTDITVDGFDGKQVEFTVPDYDEDDCADGEFGLLEERRATPGDGYWAQGPEPAPPAVDPRRRRHPTGDRRTGSRTPRPRTEPTSTRSLDSIQIG